MSLSLWNEWRLNLDFSVQTVINKFVSITWLTSDLYVSTVLHAIVFRTLPREAFPRSMFIFPTPCFRAQFQTELHRMHSDKSRHYYVSSTNGFTPREGLGKYWRLLGLTRDSRILKFEENCLFALFFFFFFLFFIMHCRFRKYYRGCNKSMFLDWIRRTVVTVSEACDRKI